MIGYAREPPKKSPFAPRMRRRALPLSCGPLAGEPRPPHATHHRCCALIEPDWGNVYTATKIIEPFHQGCCMEFYDKLKNLMIMAFADGSLTHSELEFLSDRSVQWGISEADFTAAVEFALSDNAELQIPPHEQDRIDLLQDLIRTMAADGQLAEIEKHVFAMAAAAMELPEGELDRIIDSVINS